MKTEYTDENGQYVIDCTQAIWSTDRIHDIYQDPDHLYGNLSFLCDTDFVLETEKNIILIEYKNANIQGAAHPERFNPISHNKLENVAKKFFDSIHWLYLMGKDKPKKYVYVLEYPNGNSTSRLLVRNKLIERLPFALQNNFTDTGRKIIDDIRVVDITEWNNDEELGKYPFRQKTSTT